MIDIKDQIQINNARWRRDMQRAGDSSRLIILYRQRDIRTSKIVGESSRGNGAQNKKRYREKPHNHPPLWYTQSAWENKKLRIKSVEKK